MARSPHPQTLWVRADTEQVKVRTKSCSPEVMNICAQPLITEVDGARTQGELSDPITETLVKDRERCATPNRCGIDSARTKKDSLELETAVIRAEVHAGNINEEHLVHFEESDDFSDAGSLITQAQQPDSIHATINALSSWVSAIQPRESWYLAGWIGDSPIDFLVDPGAVVSAISLPCYEKLVEANAILTPMRGHTNGTRSSQQIGHACSWNVQPGPVCSWSVNKHGHISCRLELSRYSGHGCPGRCVQITIYS